MGQLFKNVASQKVRVFAFADAGHASLDAGEPVTGDAANISARVAVDNAALGASNDAAPTEVDATNAKGYYEFDATQAETNGDVIEWYPQSSTAGVQVVTVGGNVQTTQPQYLPDLGIGSDGDVLEVNTLTGHTAQTGDSYARLGAPAGASVSADIATVDGNVDTLLTRITSTLFSGITSLAEWLGLLAGKQTGDATARTEIRATGAGSGTFDETTDALEALRDRGDSAWVTGGGGGITQSLNVQFVLPTSVDLAGTSTVRLGIILVNALDDLPSTAEITPGTISIERKSIGGTSWSAVVTDAAMSEQAGMVYYDEVFDAGTGYAEGDSLRVTFKSVSITADSNTHEVVGASGVYFQTEIRQTMRGTDSAYTGTPPTAAAIADAVLDEALSGHTTAGTAGERLGRIPNAAAGGSGGLPTVDANNHIAGIQGTINDLDGLDTAQDAQHAATQALVATVDTVVDAILVDTGTTIPALIAALNDLDSTAAQAAAAAALTAYDPPTKAELDSGLAALNDPTAAAVAAAVLAAGDVDGFTVEETLKLVLSACAAKLSGAATTTVTIRAADDSKDRITATVDADGNRSAVTLDAAG